MQADFVLLVFVVTYAGVAVGQIRGLELDRTGIALVGALLLLISGSIGLDDAIRAIDFPTILTLFGLMVLSAQLRLAGFYTLVAEKLAGHLARPAWFLFLLMTVAGTLSAVLVNDVVCLAFTPIITPALIRRGLNPVPFLVGLACASNIGSAATTIGNPQNILIAQTSSLSFGPFLLWCITPVALSLTAAYGIIWFLSRKVFHQVDPAQPPLDEVAEPALDRHQMIKGLVATLIMIVLFLTPFPHELAALVAATIVLFSRRIPSGDLLARVDGPLIVLFCSLFVVVGAFVQTGLPEQAMNGLGAAGVDLQNLYLLSGATVLLSNLISNVPAVLLLLQLLPIETATTGYVLALASTFAGNLILVGSIANLIVAEQARPFGVKITFTTFARYGIPVTLASLALLAIWIGLAA